MRTRAATWRTGGTLLAVSGLLGLGGQSLLGLTPVTGVVVDAFWFAGVVVFAIGLSRGGSVVARRPLGTAAMLVLAAAPLSRTLFSLAVGTQMDPDAPILRVLSVVLSATSILAIAAGLIAAVQIARLDAVPRRWRWAPMWAWGISVGLAVVQALVFTAVSLGDGSPELAASWSGIALVGFLAATLGLGVVALIAAAAERPESVDVYRPAAEK